MQAEVLRLFRGPLTEEEQRLIVSIQEFIREVIEHRVPLSRALAAIGELLDEQSK